MSNMMTFCWLFVRYATNSSNIQNNEKGRLERSVVNAIGVFRMLVVEET